MKPGDAVIWRQTPRGGYGYTIPVCAVIVSVTRSRVRIEVTRSRDGSKKIVSVKPENIYPRT